MRKMITTMIMVSLTGSKKPKLLHISSTQSPKLSKEIHFFIFNLKTSELSNCLSSNGIKSQILNSDSVSS